MMPMVEPDGGPPRLDDVYPTDVGRWYKPIMVVADCRPPIAEPTSRRQRGRGAMTYTCLQFLLPPRPQLLGCILHPPGGRMRGWTRLDGQTPPDMAAALPPAPVAYATHTRRALPTLPRYAAILQIHGRYHRYVPAVCPLHHHHAPTADTVRLLTAPSAPTYPRPLLLRPAACPVPPPATQPAVAHHRITCLPAAAVPRAPAPRYAQKRVQPTYPALPILPIRSAPPATVACCIAPLTAPPATRFGDCTTYL